MATVFVTHVPTFFAADAILTQKSGAHTQATVIENYPYLAPLLNNQ